MWEVRDVVKASIMLRGVSGLANVFETVPMISVLVTQSLKDATGRVPLLCERKTTPPACRPPPGKT